MKQDYLHPTQTIVRNGLCTGCGLCAAIAPPRSIAMEISREGFLRPVIDKSIEANVDEQVFKDVCPGARVEHASHGADYDPMWGPLVVARTGNALDPVTRYQGSSGGVISALALYLIETGKVDFVAQVAVSADDPLRNELQISRNRDNVLRAAGSRYAPSAPLERITELLSRGQRFAFIGKPCDVAALRRYARHDPRVNEQVPYMLSFMCAGIPSLHGTHELLAKLGVDRSKLKTFRYRGDGWPGKAKAVDTDGKVFETDYNSSWGTVLNRHLQFRCKICPDGTGEFADVVCADAWYGKDGYPDFAERDGRSLVLSRTQAGESLIEEAVKDGVVAVESLPISDIARMQPYQVNRKQVVLGRLIATRLARGTAPIYKNLSLLTMAFKAKPVEWLRNAWGTYKRATGETQ